jgi:hypothetical protein
LLGPLGEAKPTVWATYLFADPTADIAVLGSPDNQELSEQAEAYEELMENVPRPFPIGEAPKQGTKQVKLGSGRFGGTIKTPTPGLGSALLLTLNGKWIKHSVKRNGPWLWIDDQKHIESGMSGSPIVSPDCKAIGLVSTGSLNPILLEALPSRIGLHKARS